MTVTIVLSDLEALRWKHPLDGPSYRREVIAYAGEFSESVEIFDSDGNLLFTGPAK